MTSERKAALDHQVRVFLAQRLRSYYDNIRNAPVSEALSNLIKEIEQKADQEPGSALPRKPSHGRADPAS